MADVIDRVRKLLALAGSSNRHEAEAAAAKAQALIDAYRLEAILAAEADRERAAAEVEERVIERARRLRRWKSVLAAGLADVNGALAYVRQVGREREIVLVALPDDLDAIEALYLGLVPRLQWLSAEHGGKQDKRWHDDFRVGVASTLCARLRTTSETSQDRVEQAALARVRPVLARRRAAVDQFAAENLHLEQGRGLRVDPDAYRRGQAAGEAVELSGGRREDA